MENEREEVPYYFIPELVDNHYKFVYEFLHRYERELEIERKLKLIK